MKHAKTCAVMNHPDSFDYGPCTCKATNAPVLHAYAAATDRLGKLTEFASWMAKNDVQFMSMADRLDFLKAACVIRRIAETHGHPAPELECDDD